MKTKALGVLLVLAGLGVGCQETDLGRYCIVGQEVPKIGNLDFQTETQPSVTILNLQAPECQDRLCVQQGPYARYLSSGDTGDASSACPEPYEVKSSKGGYKVCVYRVKAYCSHECTEHSDCSPGPENSNSDMCTKFVCHKQGEGEPFAGHCICVCKDFLINPNTDEFYRPDEEVPPPEGCQ